MIVSEKWRIGKCITTFQQKICVTKLKNMDGEQIQSGIPGEQEQGQVENNGDAVIQEAADQQPAIPETEKEQLSSGTTEKSTTSDTVAGGKKMKAKAEANNRLTLVGNFVGDEIEYLNKIIAARKKSGITENANHFVRQCVDFAVNHVPGTTFAVPAGEKTPIKNAFYK